MQYTDKLKLKKPEGNEWVNVADLNENMDALDGEIYKINESKANGKWTFYSSLAELVVVTETIENIVNAMKTPSMLETYIGSGNANIYPEPAGTLKIEKVSDPSRTVVKFYSTNNEKEWNGLYYQPGTPSWNGWKRLANMNDIANKTSTMATITQAKFDDLNITTSYVASVNPTIANMPESSHGIIMGYAYAADTSSANGAQEIITTNNTKYYRKAVNGTVSPWILLATAQPPQEIDIPFSSGFAPYTPCKLWKNQQSEVHTNIRFFSVATFISGQIIAFLPEGFRPKYIVSIECAISLENSKVSGYIDINPDGNIKIYPSAAIQSRAVDIIVNSACFIA